MPLQNAEQVFTNPVLRNSHAINSNLAYLCSRKSTLAQRVFLFFPPQYVYFLIYFFFFCSLCFSNQIKMSQTSNSVWQIHWRYSFRLRFLSLKNSPLCVDAVYESRHVFSYFACLITEGFHGWLCAALQEDAARSRLSRLDSVTDLSLLWSPLLQRLIGTSRIRLICTNNEGIFNVLMRAVDADLECALSQNN